MTEDRLTFQQTRLALGTSTIRSMGHGVSKSVAAELLETAAALGITVVDTADTYGSAHAELAVGRHAGSHHVQVITKVGFRTVDLPRGLRFLNQPCKKLIQRVGGPQDFRLASIQAKARRSLARLGTANMLGVCLHNPTPAELRSGVVAVLQDLKSTGAFQHVGVSLDDPTSLSQWLDIPSVTLIQVPARVAVDNAAQLDDWRTNDRLIVVNQGFRAFGDFTTMLDAFSDAGLQPDIIVVGSRNPEHLADNLRVLGARRTEADSA